jgi:hypothetical protein
MQCQALFYYDMILLTFRYRFDMNRSGHQLWIVTWPVNPEPMARKVVLV